MKREEKAGALRGVDRLVYRSNTLGADLTLTNTGGGDGGLRDGFLR